MDKTLTAQSIAARLDRPMKVLCYGTIDSTNNEAKRLIASGLSEPALLIAASQTAGKGRLGRTFYSPAETGLYMSVVLHPNAPASEWLSITSAAAVAVCQAIEDLSTLTPAIKWVNDIYLNDRKVCGILTEAVTDPVSARMKSVIVGIGINLSTAVFPEAFAERAASLADGGKLTFTREALAAALCNRLCTLAEELPAGSWLPLYRERSWLDGKQITYFDPNGEHSARAVGIDRHGGLIVEDSKGIRTLLTSGEVTVRANSPAP